ncbi:caspase family protein [Sorangium sp. So ce1151]|uniref:caspase family protein n=1 Tax=Sorangium sp. So ce1151 TaxID=3133332 RepID=UPI003F6190F6
MDKTISTKTGTTHALLIGVDNYSTFDPNGGSNLRGSRNDVVLLASYCMEVLGIQAENIHVLTTPEMSLDDFQKRMIPPEIEPDESKSWLESLPRVTRGKATKDGVKDSLEWLLATSKKSAGAALFAFSGHGAWSSTAGPLLCLEDTTQDFTDGVLALKDLGAEIAKARARHKLIALFDCCHVTASGRNSRLQGKALPHLGTAQNVVDDEDLFNVSDRVILGATPGKEAFQMRLGRWHGALTFALVTAAERWRADNEVSHGSYKHVMKRAKGTLKALGVPQNPELWVAIRQSPFLGVKAGPMQREPDAEKDGAQLQPDWIYTIYLGVNTGSPVLAQVVVTSTGPVYLRWGNSTPVPINPSSPTEYWYLNTSQLVNVASAANVFITRTTLKGNSPTTPVPMN